MGEAKNGDCPPRRGSTPSAPSDGKGDWITTGICSVPAPSRRSADCHFDGPSTSRIWRCGEGSGGKWRIGTRAETGPSLGGGSTRWPDVGVHGLTPGCTGTRCAHPSQMTPPILVRLEKALKARTNVGCLIWVHNQVRFPNPTIMREPTKTNSKGK